MVRTYKKAPGKRNYMNCSQDKLEECLKLTREGVLTQRQAAKTYGIHRNTISNKLLGKHQKLSGCPTVFSKQEEQAFVDHCTVLAEWGFPLDKIDLRVAVKAYLDQNGRREKRFQNNMPGDDWAKSFLERHCKHIKERLAANIKRSQAAVSRETIEDYLSRLSVKVDGVPPENIWNLDETNLSDDPGKKKVICGWCAAPPYVAYKGERMFDAYAAGGPPGARFNVSKSGWFDMNLFLDWFQKCFLPAAKKLEGKKILIADNLSSHVSLEVLRLCQVHDIRFIFLPANSTHLLQPLDVAVFAPVKKVWRKILNDWRMANVGRKEGVIAKARFPMLLRKLMMEVSENVWENLKSGFKKTGIFPLDKEEVLKSLPRDNLEQINSSVSESFLQHLQQLRYGEEPACKRKRRVNVPPGQSITPEDLIEGVEESSSSPPNDGASGWRKRCRRQESGATTCDALTIGQYVVISYEEELFPAKVIHVDKSEECVTISCMQKSKKH
ncbi:hypothetical protein ANN_18845 [Periplaneta americana]|uniref:DDE-1 domain-containing protein n=1 Tax=Periplaneta americana TaxID=6978 RepID=A0ABQ8SS11_PERAM|nr:hypothetical protein ANN_18845 [Periplaneta americana]